MSWNGSDNTSVGRSPRDRRPAPPAPRALRHGLVAGAIVIALGLAALWFFTRPASKTPAGDPRAPRNKPRNAIAEVAPAATNAVAANAAAADTQGATVAVKSARNQPRGTIAPDDPAATNADEAAQADAGKRKRILPNASDELIALATSAPPGASLPPLPGMTEGDTDDFIKAYRKPIEIKPDDTDQIKALKERVNAVRDEIAGLIAQNPERSLSEILNEHRDQQNANVVLTSNVQEQYDAYVAEQKYDLAEKYREKANEVLRQSGAEEVKSHQENEQEEEDETNE